MRTPRNAIAAIAAISLLLTLDCKAEDKTDMHSYWYGYYMGVGQTICLLAENGQIPMEFSRKILSAMAEGDREVPQAPVNDAFAALAKDAELKGCPLPR